MCVNEESPELKVKREKKQPAAYTPGCFPCGVHLSPLQHCSNVATLAIIINLTMTTNLALTKYKVVSLVRNLLKTRMGSPDSKIGLRTSNCRLTWLLDRLAVSSFPEVQPVTEISSQAVHSFNKCPAVAGPTKNHTILIVVAFSTEIFSKRRKICA